jgi:hypothetical protein
MEGPSVVASRAWLIRPETTRRAAGDQPEGGFAHLTYWVR